ncbi:hypothetical protein MNBD_UNCLBAC01-1464, partial [hydrothermal vent metagenome]
YEFMMDALDYTQRKYKRKRHVSGEEILEGIKELLMKDFGPLTITVLEHWSITSTEDFGNIIFNLVNNKVLNKTDEDDIAKFKDAYDFEEVFDQGYRKKLHKKVSRMRTAGGMV